MLSDLLRKALANRLESTPKSQKSISSTDWVEMIRLGPLWCFGSCQAPDRYPPCSLLPLVAAPYLASTAELDEQGAVATTSALAVSIRKGACSGELHKNLWVILYLGAKSAHGGRMLPAESRHSEADPVRNAFPPFTTANLVAFLLGRRQPASDRRRKSHLDVASGFALLKVTCSFLTNPRVQAGARCSTRAPASAAA